MFMSGDDHLSSDNPPTPLLKNKKISISSKEVHIYLIYFTKAPSLAYFHFNGIIPTFQPCCKSIAMSFGSGFNLYDARTLETLLFSSSRLACTQKCPEHKSENLLNTVQQLGRIVESPISESDILHVTRIAKLNKESNRPRSVIVKLRSQRHRNELLAAVTRFNKKNKDKKLSTEHLGLGGRREPIFVSEHLTLSNKQLHAAARKKAKEAGFKFVWIRDGRILTRKSEQSQAIHIKDDESLKLLL
ncbi:unnamed protein product [Euphydryas editha]|uniref:FP protein C-terminal domain-containing protein n=1 Tax=Euphydryas editha TaxID=104508 RepID=A0AAU9TG20_EUPED|nr:unnamed protein product [Euphydryas editha]